MLLLLLPCMVLLLLLLLKHAWVVLQLQWLQGTLPFTLLLVMVLLVVLVLVVLLILGLWLWLLARPPAASPDDVQVRPWRAARCWRLNWLQTRELQSLPRPPCGVTICNIRRTALLHDATAVAVVLLLLLPLRFQPLLCPNMLLAVKLLLSVVQLWAVRLRW